MQTLGVIGCSPSEPALTWLAPAPTCAPHAGGARRQRGRRLAALQGRRQEGRRRRGGRQAQAEGGGGRRGQPGRRRRRRGGRARQRQEGRAQGQGGCGASQVRRCQSPRRRAGWADVLVELLAGGLLWRRPAAPPGGRAAGRCRGLPAASRGGVPARPVPHPCCCHPCRRPCPAGAKRRRKEVRSYYNDAGEEVFGECGGGAAVGGRLLCGKRGDARRLSAALQAGARGCWTRQPCTLPLAPDCMLPTSRPPQLPATPLLTPLPPRPTPPQRRWR